MGAKRDDLDMHFFFFFDFGIVCTALLRLEDDQIERNKKQ